MVKALGGSLLRRHWSTRAFELARVPSASASSCSSRSPPRSRGRWSTGCSPRRCLRAPSRRRSRSWRTTSRRTRVPVRAVRDVLAIAGGARAHPDGLARARRGVSAAVWWEHAGTLESLGVRRLRTAAELARCVRDVSAPESVGLVLARPPQSEPPPELARDLAGDLHLLPGSHVREEPAGLERDEPAHPPRCSSARRWTRSNPNGASRSWSSCSVASVRQRLGAGEHRHQLALEDHVGDLLGIEEPDPLAGGDRQPLHLGRRGLRARARSRPRARSSAVFSRPASTGLSR